MEALFIILGTIVVTIVVTILITIILILLLFRGAVHIYTDSFYFYNITVGWDSDVHSSIHFISINKFSLKQDDDPIIILNMFTHSKFKDRNSKNKNKFNTLSVLITAIMLSSCLFSCSTVNIFETKDYYSTQVTKENKKGQIIERYEITLISVYGDTTTLMSQKLRVILNPTNKKRFNKILLRDSL